MVGGPVVADQPAREADQDRSQGGQPRALLYVSDGRGRGVPTDVPGNPVTHLPAAGTASASMRVLGQMRQATTGEVRLDERKAARLSASAQSTGGFDRLLRTRCAICHCPRRPKGRPWLPTTRNPGNI